MKLLLILFFFTGSSLYGQTVTTLRIDPDNALGGTTSQIFDSVRFIPLETTKESLFGKIYKLDITDKYFIITDFDTWSVLVFEKNGKFHAKIKKRSANEYFSPAAVNKPGQEIIIPVIDDKVLFYNFDGKFLREEKSVPKAARLFWFNPQSVAYNINRPLKPDRRGEKRYDVVYSNGLRSITKELFPYNPKYAQYEYNLPETVFSDNSDGTCFFTFPYDYTASHLNDTGIVRQFKFIFPQKYSLPANFASDSSFADKRKDYVFSSQGNTGKYVALTPFFKMKDYLIFHIEQIGLVYGDNDNLAYSLRTGSTYLLNRVTGDASSYYIPLLDSHLNEDLLGVYNNHIYTTIPSFLLFDVKASSSKVTSYGPELELLFARGTAKSNPVIIESKLKDGL